jgi:hypothetical protein
MKIKIKKLDGKTEDVEIQLTDRVDKLKAQFADRTGIDKRQLLLIFKGKPLLDDTLLGSYNLQEGDKVHVMTQLRGGGSSSMQIVIQSSLSDTIYCILASVDSSTTIETLKERISKETNMPVANFYLRSKTRKLEDDKTLGDYNLFSPLTLTLVHTFQQRICNICTEIKFNRPNWGTPQRSDPVFFTCGHQLHYKCFVQLLQTSTTCPECRKPLAFEAHCPKHYQELLAKAMSE